MNPAFDATAQANTGAVAATSLTYTHTCTGTGLALVVGVGSTVAPTKVTYNGVPLTKISTDVSNTIVSSVWILFGPTTGANSVVITMGSSVAILGGSISVTGANQEGTHISFDGDTVAAGTAITTIMTPARADCILIDNLAINLNSGPAISGGATAAVDQSSSAAVGQAMSYEVVTGSPSTTFSYTWVGTGKAAHRIIAIPAPFQSFPANHLRPHPFSPGLAR